MPHQIVSDLLVELSTEQQELLAGGQGQTEEYPVRLDKSKRRAYIFPSGDYYYWWKVNRKKYPFTG